LKRQLYCIYTIIFILLLCLPGQALAGKITGTVKVKGLRSPANILVYLTNTPPISLDVTKARFVMDQQNLTFLPHILPMPVGATVQFPNNDKVDHNVFSMSRTKFNLGSYKPGEIKTILFDKAGIVELRCDVHAEMSAYILVMKNPYWAITDAQGKFEIPDIDYLKQQGVSEVENLPSGKYFIKTWHEKLKTQKSAVVVPNNEDVSVEIDLTRGTPSVLYK
jgi:plastocyanin